MNSTGLKALDNQQLVELTGATDWASREAASSTLMERGIASLDDLVQGLYHWNWRVRAACAALMDHLADARCEVALQHALHDSSPHVRRHAIHALGCQRCKITPLQADIVALLVERSLADSSIRVRRVAVHQLGLQAHDQRAVEALQTIVDRETDVKLLSRARFALVQQQRSMNHECPARFE